MLPTSPPNHLHTLDERDTITSDYQRRIVPVVGYIVLLLLLLYVLYNSSMHEPVSKGKPVKKPWYISQGFFYVLRIEFLPAELLMGERLADETARPPAASRRLAASGRQACGPLAIRNRRRPKPVVAAVGVQPTLLNPYLSPEAI